MYRYLCHSKIHRATVTAADLHYVGSITIDRELLRMADIRPFEQVHVLNIRNGARLVTYAFEGASDTGIIQINGAAAHHFEPGDLIIIISYCEIEEKEMASGYRPRVVFVDRNNRQVGESEVPREEIRGRNAKIDVKAGVTTDIQKHR